MPSADHVLGIDQHLGDASSPLLNEQHVLILKSVVLVVEENEILPVEGWRYRG